MAGSTAHSAEDILSKICGIFEEILMEVLTAVYNKGIPRVQWITEHKGEYYHKV
jgi:hypothetical protein